MIKIIILIIMIISHQGGLQGRMDTDSTPGLIDTPVPTIAPTEGNASVGNVINPGRQMALITDGLTMGDPNAKVKVTEFADFQCPACGGYWSDIEPEIISEYVDTGKVFFTYSPFSFLGQYGSDPNWDESVKAAEAAYCANDQGMFWEYRDMLFANQSGENEGAFNRYHLIAFANTIGLDNGNFVECLDAGKYTQTVTDDFTSGVVQGATFTPSFLIDGTIVGMGDLVQTIENSLK
jgi:protein-disulfide isomerase